MAKRGSTTFSATKVAKAGLVASAPLQKIMDLEKEVSKLRHHVSFLSKRNHMWQKEADGRKKEEGAVSSEVASPGRVEEPELQVVAELLERMSGVIVVEEEEDVWVAPVAKQVLAESRVMLEVDKHEVALVRLLKGKRRRTCGEVEVAVGEEVEEVVVGEVGIMVATSISRAPAGMVLVAASAKKAVSPDVSSPRLNEASPLFASRPSGSPEPSLPFISCVWCARTLHFPSKASDAPLATPPPPSGLLLYPPPYLLVYRPLAYSYQMRASGGPPRSPLTSSDLDLSAPVC